jgi:preprotein translocase subunit SecF
LDDLFENGITLRCAQIGAGDSSKHPETTLEAIIKECDVFVFKSFKLDHYISSTTASLEVFFLATLYFKFQIEMNGFNSKQAAAEEVEEAKEEVEEAKEEVEEAKEEVEEAKEEVDASIEDVDAGRAEVDAGREDVDAGREEVDAGREDVEEGDEEKEQRKGKYTPSVVYEKIMEYCNIISNQVLHDRMKSFAEGTIKYFMHTSSAST